MEGTSKKKEIRNFIFELTEMLEARDVLIPDEGWCEIESLALEYYEKVEKRLNEQGFEMAYNEGKEAGFQEGIQEGIEIGSHEALEQLIEINDLLEGVAFDND